MAELQKALREQAEKHAVELQQAAVKSPQGDSSEAGATAAVAAAAETRLAEENKALKGKLQVGGYELLLLPA